MITQVILFVGLVFDITNNEQTIDKIEQICVKNDT